MKLQTLVLQYLKITSIYLKFLPIRISANGWVISTPGIHKFFLHGGFVSSIH